MRNIIKHTPKITSIFLYLIVIFTILLSACGEGNQSSNSSSISASPTSRPSPTATVKPKPRVNPHSLTLGGTEAAFIKKYGDSVFGKAGSDEFQDTKDNLDIFIGFRSSYDGTPDTFIVDYANPSPLSKDQSWPASTGKAICQSYLPADAKYVKVVPSVQQDSGLGIIVLYNSNLLANSLPADEFIDYNQNPVKPGTIFIDYSYHNLNDSSRIDSCIVTTIQIDN